LNHIYQSNEANNPFRLSDAAEYHHREEGSFEVRHSKAMVRSFATLASAFLYYLRLNEPATLWDVTDKNSILIERKIMLMSMETIAIAC
jgi:hypothetical protein